MTLNIGTADRMVRFLVGIVLILAPLANVIGLSLSTPVTVVCVVIGVVLVATASFRFCPLYTLFGASTCSR